MIVIQRFFVFIFLFNVVGCLAMSEKDLYVEQLRDIIDIQLVRIDTDSCFRVLQGSFWSYYKNLFLTDNKALLEVRKIGDYIARKTNNFSEQRMILKELFTHHWYVYYVMKMYTAIKLREIESVKGSTIDKLWITDKNSDNCIENVAYNKAFEEFFDKVKIQEMVYLYDIPEDKRTEIHCKTLRDSKNALCEDCLIMSSDSQYLKSLDVQGNELVWDMHKGKLIDNQSVNSIIWCPYAPTSANDYKSCIISRNDRYVATNTLDDLAIILFRKPTQVTYLCQKAFGNNCKDHSELSALRNSKTLGLVDCFPAENLKKMIDQRLLLNKELQQELGTIDI